MRVSKTKPVPIGVLGISMGGGEPRIQLTKTEQRILVKAALLSEQWRELWADMNDGDFETDEGYEVARVWMGVEAMFGWADLDLAKAIKEAEASNGEEDVCGAR
jgi:hypothetical protein